MKNKPSILIIFFSLCFLLQLNSQITPGSEDNFVTIWNTMDYDFITIPTVGEGYNYDLYWEEVDNPGINGTLSAITGDVTLSSLTPGQDYRIEIVGDFPRIFMFKLEEEGKKLLQIQQWGSITWNSLDSAFWACRNMDLIAQDVPDLSELSSLGSMFYNCNSLKGEGANWDWDISGVSNLRGMFTNAVEFNGDITGWDVSNVTDMGLLFAATAFDRPIGNWDVRSVKKMDGMFYGAQKFNQEIGSWDVSMVEDMSFMFYKTQAFNQDISSWDVKNVITMRVMFAYTESFNQSLNEWDVSNVIDMSGMFSYAEAFNGNVNEWDVSNVVSMEAMFAGNSIFNQSLNNWDVSNVENMSYMFFYSTAFNQDISNWDVSNVMNMESMFERASGFNQNLGNWTLGEGVDLFQMLNDAGMDCVNYSATLEGWANNPNTPEGRYFVVSNLRYGSSAINARDSILIGEKNWTIIGDQLTGLCLEAGEAFITLWNTLNTDSLFIPTQGAGYNYDLYWEEVGNPENSGFFSGHTGDLTIFGLTPGQNYRVEIVGDFPRFYMNNNFDEREKLFEIKQWGKIEWSSMENAFFGCANMDVTANDVPDLSGVGSIRNMFTDCESLVGDRANWEWNTSNVHDMHGLFDLAWRFNQDIGSWDVGNVTDMSFMFYGEIDFAGTLKLHHFNQDISNWDVSNVENMAGMFMGASEFNQDLSTWDVSSVVNMSNMFFEAASFYSDLSTWDVSNVMILSSTFARTDSFNSDLSGWDVSNVTNMSGMFRGADSFNSDISGWDVSNVTNMGHMFNGALSFNGDLSGWDVSNVTNMNTMFATAELFNSDISSWDVSNVTNMGHMFTGARLFDADITGWDVSNVQSMAHMFSGTLFFNHDISVWDISSVTNMSHMFSFTINFNQDISVWDIGNVTNLTAVFLEAESFNQDISGWDVSNVSNFWLMFHSASSFNQNLADWDISSASNMRSMFNNSGMQCENYSATLIGWASQENVPSGMRLGAIGMEYAPSAAQYRNNILIDQKGWEIMGDQEGDCSPVNTINFDDEDIALTIYPNPVVDKLYFEPVNELGKAEITVFNSTGKTVDSFEISLNAPQSVDVNHWKPGVYLLQISSSDISRTIKVIRQ